MIFVCGFVNERAAPGAVAAAALPCGPRTPEPLITEQTARIGRFAMKASFRTDAAQFGGGPAGILGGVIFSATMSPGNL
jgi:hypothetical protein